MESASTSSQDISHEFLQSLAGEVALRVLLVLPSISRGLCLVMHLTFSKIRNRAVLVTGSISLMVLTGCGKPEVQPIQLVHPLKLPNAEAIEPQSQYIILLPLLTHRKEYTQCFPVQIA